MKRIINQYYRFIFLAGFISFTVYVLTVKTVSTYTVFEKIFIAFMGALMLSALLGTVYYIYDTKWEPKRRAKFLSGSPFKELKEQGFQQEEQDLWGQINGYIVYFSFTWYLGYPSVLIEVFFHPNPNGRYLSDAELNGLEKRNKNSSLSKNPEYVWSMISLGCFVSYGFKPPSAEKVQSKAKELTEILIKEQMQPIAKEEMEEAWSGVFD